MKRTPMRRNTPGAIAWSRKPRKPLAPMSQKRRDYYRKVYEPLKRARLGGPCEARTPVCTGKSEHLHEVLSRGRAGGLEAAVREGPVMATCDRCNGYIAEHPRWAEAKGLLIRRRPHMT